MNEHRLIACFRTVFPDLPDNEIVSATQASVPAWDSIASITLVNVIEEEFPTQVDFDALAEIDSFQGFLSFLNGLSAS